MSEYKESSESKQRGKDSRLGSYSIEVVSGSLELPQQSASMATTLRSGGAMEHMVDGGENSNQRMRSLAIYQSKDRESIDSLRNSLSREVDSPASNILSESKPSMTTTSLELPLASISTTPTVGDTLQQLDPSHLLATSKKQKSFVSEDNRNHDSNASDDCSRSSLDAARNKSCNMESEAIGEDRNQTNKKTAKKDRSKLRKGKWAVEEEEYTTRIIQHFSTGLLMLPEGATLRSYLAERLNCDPMRITKKFTGACCLGRRVYHLRDRPQASQAEIDTAKAELEHLRQRFQQRVDHEQSGIPLNRSQELLLAHGNGAKTLYPLQTNPMAVTPPPWLQNFSVPMPAKTPSTHLSSQAHAVPTIAPSPWTITTPLVPGQQPQWLLPWANGAFPTAVPTSGSSPADSTVNSALNNAFASWAWAQAATSLAPALSCLAVANLQKQQNCRVKEEEPNALTFPGKFEPDSAKSKEIAQISPVSVSKSSAAPSAGRRGLNSTTQEGNALPVSSPISVREDSKMPYSCISATAQLRKSYEAHLQSLKMTEDTGTKETRQSLINDDTDCTAPNSLILSKDDSTVSEKRGHDQIRLHNNCNSEARSGENLLDKAMKSASPDNRGTMNGKSSESGQGNQSSRPSEDEEAGTILLGFLQSLQKSYTEAIKDDSKGSSLCEESNQNWEKRAGSDEQSSQTSFADANCDEKKVKPIATRQRKSANAEKTDERIVAAESLDKEAIAIPPLKLSKGQAKSHRSNDVNQVSKTPKTLTEQVQGQQSAPRHCTDPKPKLAERIRTASPDEQTPPHSVTDTSTLSRSETSSGSSSNRNESSSSIEDSDSKSDKTDQSSGEESEKESLIPVPKKSNLPPRKRLKARHQVHEFTTKNVREHSKRMTYELDHPIKKQRKF